MDAKVMHGVNDAMEFIGSLNVPGAYLAETLPILKYVPHSWRHGRTQLRRLII
jgi:hypothetical protein